MPQHDAAPGVATAPASWAAVEQLFGTKGEPSRCWCRWFALTGADWKISTPDNRKEQLKAAFSTGPAPGVLAFVGNRPIGWCAVEPRANYPRLKKSHVLRGSKVGFGDEANPWAVSCFVVEPGHRRSGVSSALLAAAKEHAFGNGADVIEAYPVNTAVRTKATAAELFHGTVSLFGAAGFSIVSRPSPGRAVMRCLAGTMTGGGVKQ